MGGYLNISIHAPPQGGRHRSDGRTFLFPRYFNPRPREGGDTNPTVRCSSITDFNPRPREGGDDTPKAKTSYSINFNPRPREGGDLHHPAARYPWSAISIHAPVRGATTLSDTHRAGRRNFNPRPREGGDRRPEVAGTTDTPFQSTLPARGATKNRTPYCPRTSNFNPRPPRGGRHQQNHT